jgi:hypothetical protein
MVLRGGSSSVDRGWGADAIAITGYTIFINIAVTGSGGNLGWQIAHGPLSIVFGVIAGLGASLIACPTKLWNNAYKRTAVVFILGNLLPTPIQLPTA